VSPKVFYSAPHVGYKVKSLQPELVWKAPPGAGDMFDVIIYSGIKKQLSMHSFYQPGKELYYREGVSGTSHKVEVPLPPDTFCLWGVRTRKDGVTGPWSTYSGQDSLNGTEYADQWWRFTTPKE